MAVQLNFRENARAFLRAHEGERRGVAELARHSTLVVGNDATDERGRSYPEYLQRRAAYTVVDDKVVDEELGRVLRAVLASPKPMNRVRLRSAFALAADRAVGRMLAFTGRVRPPVRRGAPRRPAHEGGWADVTTALAKGYFWRFSTRGPKRRREYHGRRYDR